MNSIYFSLDDTALKLKTDNYSINVLTIHLSPYLYYIASHFHKIFEMHYVIGGSAVVKIDDLTYNASAGSVYITGPDVEHEQISDPNNVLMEYCISFDISNMADKSTKGLSDCGYDYVFSKLIKIKSWFGNGSDACFELWDKIASEAVEKRIGFLDNIKGLILQLISETVRTILDSPSAKDVLPVKSVEDKRISILDANMLWDFADTTLETLANQLGISTKQASRLIKKHYRMSFEQRITKSKLDMATRLLKTTDMSINEIGAAVGYSSIHYFSRRFKENCGVSPVAFRNLHKKDN